MKTNPVKKSPFFWAMDIDVRTKREYAPSKLKNLSKIVIIDGVYARNYSRINHYFHLIDGELFCSFTMLRNESDPKIVKMYSDAITFNKPYSELSYPVKFHFNIRRKDVATVGKMETFRTSEMQGYFDAFKAKLNFVNASKSVLARRDLRMEYVLAFEAWFKNAHEQAQKSTAETVRFMSI